MKPIDFFKLQAKNLFRDYKTRASYIGEIDGDTYFGYSPTYFDIETLFMERDWDDSKFSLMTAQHFIANMVGFTKWTELIKASPTEQKLAKLLFENQHKIHIEDWEMYVAQIEYDNQTTVDADYLLQLFTEIFVKVDRHVNPFPDYRLHPNQNLNM